MEIEVNGEIFNVKQNLIMSSQSIPLLRQNIYKWLERIGIAHDYIAIENGPFPKDAWSEVKWEVNGDEFFYRCNSQSNNKNCLAAIEQLVHQEVIFIERGIKTFGQVMSQFRIGYDPDGKKILNPWQILGIDPKIKDMGYITFRYKTLAKENHPDAGGDIDKFKEINEAYKQLKEQLEVKNVDE